VSGLEALVVVLVIVVALDIVAAALAKDSRDGNDWADHPRL
jgi:hypothetical protein